MAEKSDIEADLARVRARLADLDAEQRELQRKMVALEAHLAAEHALAVKQPSFDNAPVTNASPSHEKVDLFRRLFAGRPDVFPVRWENRKTGRSGYSPAC
ncbi:TOTE conflict system archaeo-eukaryotic primase domain-containing protein, partial [Pseudodonghicola xiamenensis]